MKRSNKKNKSSQTPDQRQQVFEVARDMICANTSDDALTLLHDSINAQHVAISDANKCIKNISNRSTLYSDKQAYTDVAELIVFHNVIDYTLGGPDGERFIMIASDGHRVFIYCPTNNVLVEFNFDNTPNLSSVSMYFMIAFTILYGGDVQIGG